MEKQKRWQFLVIIAVCLLTLYNILPTIIFYSKPLKEPVDAVYAKNVSVEIANRVNLLEQDAVKWMHSFCDLWDVKPSRVQSMDKRSPVIRLQFPDEKERQLFSKFLPQKKQALSFLSCHPSSRCLKNRPLTIASKCCAMWAFILMKAIQKLFRFSPKQVDGKDRTSILNWLQTALQALRRSLAAHRHSLQRRIYILEDKDNLDSLLFLARKVAKVSEKFQARLLRSAILPPLLRQTFQMVEGLSSASQQGWKRPSVHLSSRNWPSVMKRKYKEEKGELIETSKLELAETLQGQIVL